MKVYNPSSGVFLLLEWWTYYGRSHMILARNEKALTTVAKRAFREEGGEAELRAFLEIEMVAPPTSLCERSAQKLRQQAVALFLSEVSYRLSDLLKAGHPVPAPFVLCTEYKYRHDDEPEEDWPWEHYECANCENGVRLDKLSPGDFYNQYQARWDTLMSDKIVRQPTAKIELSPSASRGRVAENEVGLWYASANFGHHSSGIDLLEVENDEALTREPLFFYLVKRVLDKSELQQLLDKRKAERALEIERRQARAAEAQAQEKLARIDKLASFFAEKA